MIDEENNQIFTIMSFLKIPEGEIYLRPPTQFIQENYMNLLPSWRNCPKTMMFILYFSDHLITDNPLSVESEKQRFKEKFLQWGDQLRLKAREKKTQIEIIDPQNGYPIYSTHGTLSFHIVAIIHEQLGWRIEEKEGCKILNHPTQKTAIYPCLLLSGAEELEIQFLVQDSFYEV